MTLKPIAAMLIAGGLAMAQPALSAGMSREAYNAEKDRIDAAYKAEHAKCDGLKDNAKDVCQKEAKAHQKVAKAEAEAQYRGTARAQTNAKIAKADAEYDVAKEKCDDKSGDAKDACQDQAKATHSKAVAEAKGKKQNVSMNRTKEKS
jgi:hypothetical protein